MFGHTQAMNAHRGSLDRIESCRPADQVRLNPAYTGSPLRRPPTDKIPELFPLRDPLFDKFCVIEILLHDGMSHGIQERDIGPWTKRQVQGGIPRQLDLTGINYDQICPP